MNVVAAKFRISHWHYQTDDHRTHEHDWLLSVESNHPTAHPVLVHAFMRFVSTILPSGALYVEDYQTEDVVGPMAILMQRYLEEEVKVTIVEL